MSESKEPLTLLIKIGGEGSEASEAHFVAGLFAYCDHDHFRYTKPPIASRIKALRFIADTLEINSQTTDPLHNTMEK